jgi:hypothetical protein
MKSMFYECKQGTRQQRGVGAVAREGRGPMGRKMGEGEEPLTGWARVTVRRFKPIQTGQTWFKLI